MSNALEDRQALELEFENWTSKPSVRPSKVSPDNAQPFTLDQELEPFARWTSKPIWVPPKDSSTLLAKSMLKRFGALHSKQKAWAGVTEEHRDSFTQVREIELKKASIRLPKGRLYVTITDQQRFDTIEDPIPACVQTRLDEFLEGPGKKPGVKVYYLKPLCMEVDDQLIFTTSESLRAAIGEVQEEVFAEYRRGYLIHRPAHWARKSFAAATCIPRKIYEYFDNRRQRILDAYQAQLEFKRRKIALRAARLHCRTRTDGCTFDEMLALTNPLERTDVIEQYSTENELSKAQRDALLRIAAGTLPWFAALAYAASFAPGIIVTLTAPPVLVCDPAFVAEMPDAPGTLLKIGHFDEVGGVTHVEI